MSDLSVLSENNYLHECYIVACKKNIHSTASSIWDGDMQNVPKYHVPLKMK